MINQERLKLYAKDKSLLIVEDDPITQKIIQKSFNEYFDTIITAIDGKEGLEKYIEYGGFDIVLTDINMPNMNGVNLAKEIKYINYDQAIIILSAISDEKHFIDLIELNVDSFILKPFDFNKLASKILKILENKAHIKIIEEYQREQIVSLQKDKEKDKMLLQQSKLAVMGEMLSMIAHQWRQPLAVISVLASGINFKKTLNKLTDEELLEKSTEIKDVSKQMSHTINDFTNFFKPTKNKKIINLEELINEAIYLTSALFEINSITIDVIADDNINIELYEGEFKQVIINILSNAKDALIMHKEDNRKIDINIFKDEIENKVTLFIKDNAKGIPKNIIDKIFEPYFSTKSKNGTGLGLYMSRIIINEHLNGKIEVFNDNEGAVFKIALPLKN